MHALADTARELLRDFEGNSYIFGPGAIRDVGGLAARAGERWLLVTGRSSRQNGMGPALEVAFREAGLSIVGQCAGARPNSPVEDVLRVRGELLAAEPDAVVGLGGGSLIDALKASVVLATLGGACEDYYGVGKVSDRLAETSKRLPPVLAVQTASGSGAHLTKYANVTDMAGPQKKLFIDDAVVPPLALFDYDATVTMSREFTAVGAFDGICHLLEVYLGIPPGDPRLSLVQRIALVGLELIIGSLPQVLRDPTSTTPRESIGLGTDLGGHAIMVGSTNGPHLNSFSLVDVMDHGKATAILAPYYTYFFAPAVPDRIARVGEIYQRYGHLGSRHDLPSTEPLETGALLAEGMMHLARTVGFPTSLGEVPSYTDVHEQRMLSAAKDPALASKLESMPVPMRPEDVDRYMANILRAARGGDLSLISPPPGYT
jgi:alcohol dehydrogenase